MNHISATIVAVVLSVSNCATAAPDDKGVVTVDFQKPLAGEWKTIGGKWEVEDGSLRQAEPGFDDPTKAILVLGDRYDAAEEVVLTAKLRIDAWAGGDYSRAGISIASDPANGRGINLVFQKGQLRFLHDYVAWGPSCIFAHQVGKWYWIKLSKKDGELNGKAWPDGEREPTDWMVTWNRSDDEIAGYPAVVGGSGGPGGEQSAVSFARFEVVLGSGPAYYLKKATWFETMLASREALTQQDTAAAAKLPKLWKMLRRDFSDAASLHEMTAEQRDGIWNENWPAGAAHVPAERYATAARAGLAPQARELATTVKQPADLEPVRKLYHRSREIEDTLARWKDSNVASLRLAVRDLMQTHGSRYAKGPQYLERILQLEKSIADARRSAGRVNNVERLYESVREFESLRDEALLANPLLDFDRLLLVKRKDARAYSPAPSFAPAPFAGKDHLLNGLPTNFQGNAVLRQVPIDNEIAVLSPVRADGRLTTLLRPAKPAYAGDLKLHFDADRLLFSSIGTHDRFQIFEIGADGRNLRQVTRGEEADVDNYDACYLADDRILFGSSACFQSVPCERRYDEVANLYVMQSDGSDVRRLCFDQDHNFYPTMLSDGRVLYTRWEYTDIAHAFSARLFTMNPDGTRQRAYYGSGGFWPNRIFYAKPIPGSTTRFVGIVTGHHGTQRAGELVTFDTAQGRRQADGAVQRIPGWGKKVEPVLVDNLVDGSWPKFLHPHPLSDKYFLVSCQPTPQSPWGVYLVDVFDNMVLLHAEEGWLLFEPVPLRKTPRPPLIQEQVASNSQEATVYLSDIYVGEGLKGIPRGTVKKLRLFTYHFNYFGTSGIEDYIGMDGPWDVRRVLGTVPVADDGSAYFTVPANTPIALQPLDAEGKSLQLMRSWFTAMPGEAVSCVGCHEYANSSPPARLPAAVYGVPARIEPWYGPARGFSWDREVQPVLDKYCVGCHNGQPPADIQTALDLRHAEPRKMPLSDAPFPPSFYELRRFVRSPGLEGDPRVLPAADYHADTSPLVQMLRKGHQNVRLDDEAWDRLVTWMDMNAPAYGAWLDVPTVRGNAAVQVCRDRRIESQRRYGGLDEDPETVSATSRETVTPIMPPAMPSAAPVKVAGWPFDAGEAKRRQSDSGAQTELDVDLGAGVKMRMVLIPPGQFVMGDGAGYPDEQPLCQVKIDRPFWMGQLEVTNEQFARFDPSHESGIEPMLWLKWTWEDFVALNQPRQPVCRVSWEEAGGFCRWLSRQTGRKFALPTEAQWEWACRAGSDTAMSFGLAGTDSASFANLADASLLNSTGWARTKVPFSRLERVKAFYAADPVDDKHNASAVGGSYQSNPWGLHDMHGNVAEWTRSAYVPYPFHADDPRQSDRSSRRVVRGGSWYVRADLARSGCRTSYWPWQRVFDVGFRVTCEAEEPN